MLSFYGHICLILCNILPQDLDERKVSILMEANFFLAKRHTWGLSIDDFYIIMHLQIGVMISCLLLTLISQT